MRQIATNAGVEGSVIIEKVKNSEAGMGYDALHDEYVNMIKAGIVDPTKVTRVSTSKCSISSINILNNRSSCC